MSSLAINDPIWRLNNLYSCKDAGTGQLVPFRPKPEQALIYDAIHRRKLKRIIIPKARQMGHSTGIGIDLVDAAMFNAGSQISIIDKTLVDASNKLSIICKTAFESAEKNFFPGVYTRGDDSKSKFEVGVKGDLPSAIHAGLYARGGTNQRLHISELGVIQVDDPQRAEEIWTGAVPTAAKGVIVIETTWKGGRYGTLYEKIDTSLKADPDDLSRNDWHTFFFPWWVEKSYSLEEGSIRDDLITYFRETEIRISDKEKREFRFTDGQKRWYSANYLGIFMFREYPSLIEEMFQAPVEGAIYATQLERAKSENRITTFPVDTTALVNTSWDLGAPKNTTTWYWQLIGDDIKVIEVEGGLDLTPVNRVAHMLAKGYPLGHHYFPHDAATTETTGRTAFQELQDAGLQNMHVVPKTRDIWIGINRLKDIFPRLKFRIPHTDRGVEMLGYYHTAPREKMGASMDKPVHDESSHWADGLRIMAEAEMSGMLRGGSATALRSRRKNRVTVIKGIGSIRRRAF